jgi:hypothetical protein
MMGSPYKIHAIRWEPHWGHSFGCLCIVISPPTKGIPSPSRLIANEKPASQPKNGFLLLFSATSFPSADLQLEWVREDGSGNIYLWREAGQEGWLCPALLRYFDRAPAELYVQLKEVQSDL